MINSVAHGQTLAVFQKKARRAQLATSPAERHSGNASAALPNPALAGSASQHTHVCYACPTDPGRNTTACTLDSDQQQAFQSSIMVVGEYPGGKADTQIAKNKVSTVPPET